MKRARCEFNRIFGASTAFANCPKKSRVHGVGTMEEERSLNKMACKVRVKNMMKFNDNRISMTYAKYLHLFLKNKTALH